MLATLVVFIAYLLAATARWLTRKFGVITVDQIIFHLNMPLDSSEKLIRSYFSNVWLAAAGVALVFYLVFVHKYRKDLPLLARLRRYAGRSAAGFLLISLIYTAIKMRVDEMWGQYQRFQTVSTFFEDNYVDPRQVKLTFPQRKRNLILIFMESMDTAHLQSANYDYFKTNLTPELQKLARENINFSDNGDIGGAYQVKGANFTQAGLTAQTCGLPLKLPIESSHFRPDEGFLPGAKCLYDFLKENGYEQTLVNGMPKTFAGLDKFLESHGNIKLMDTWYMQEHGLLKPEDYSEGVKIVKDRSLLEISKREIERLASGSKPFAFTVMTIDTHLGKQFFDGDHCERRFGRKDKHHRYKNIFACQSRLLGEFVEWIKAQPFYENTTVVMVADHLLMYDAGFTRSMKDKRILNIFINPYRQPEKYKNRRFLSFDIYPTIMSALGVRIDGGKLGLGTSLYDGQPTLLEREGSAKKVDKKLDMRSKRYEKMLYGKVIGED